ncbi:MaoC family dehydratase [Paenibacillus sp. J22TS3]|uniref:MaoC family dehydratase n=1 Tax=Paenibacillus sp. J22TS3 TaxID=2807192 RepID=UPI001B191A3A|nr:MaoC family dehydratase [Paenibacillus sp. J22TS3]GIP23362.1 hypothetical protein J22TS3_36370 [Paenibacillus sp. J22TS3]
MRKQITAEGIRRYAVASKDMADIHLDDEAAQRAGYKRPIAHGMYIMGLAQSIYAKEHKEKWIQSCGMRFQKPLPIDTAVNFVYEEQGGSVLVTVTAEDGGRIATGTLTVKEGVTWLDQL